MKNLQKLSTEELEREARRRGIKSVEELTASDDFMFGALMRRESLCAGVIERLLGIRPAKITYPEIQKTIRPFYGSKGIRLDVLAEDEEGIYNLEIQTSDFASLPLRVRYYQSLLDTDSLMKGEKYSTLRRSFIIFICTGDPFGRGLPVYTFENTCREDFSLGLGDKTVKMFYNVTAWESDKDGERASLLRYMQSGVPTTPFTARLHKELRAIKDENTFRREYMMRNIDIEDAIDRGIAQGMAKGMAQGITKGMALGMEQNLRSNILGLNRNNVPIGIIASSVGRTQAEVEEIIRNGTKDSQSRFL